MMTAMLHSSNSSYGLTEICFYLLNPTLIISTNKINHETNLEHTFKTDLFEIKNENPIQRSLPATTNSSTNISPPIPSIITPKLPEDNSLPLNKIIIIYIQILKIISVLINHKTTNEISIFA